jgi:hypothetical protein
VFSDGFEGGTLANRTSSSGIVVQGASMHMGTYAAGPDERRATYAKKR